MEGKKKRWFNEERKRCWKCVHISTDCQDFEFIHIIRLSKQEWFEVAYLKVPEVRGLAWGGRRPFTLDSSGSQTDDLCHLECHIWAYWGAKGGRNTSNLIPHLPEFRRPWHSVEMNDVKRWEPPCLVSLWVWWVWGINSSLQYINIWYYWKHEGLRNARGIVYFHPDSLSNSE